MSEDTNDIGLMLKRERLRKSQTLEMVHDMTKIPIDSLKAIEEGYKVRTLTAFYYKSFVRIYALHLGMDPQPLLGLIPSAQLPPKVSEPRMAIPVSQKIQETALLNIFAGSMRSNSFHKVVKTVLYLAVIAAGIALIVFLARKVHFPAPKVESGSVKALPAVHKIVTESSSKTDAVPKVDKKVHASSAPVEAKLKKEEENNRTIEAKALKSVLVAVRAQSNSWLVVKTDGNVAFQGVLKKGNSETWTAQKLVEISGNDIDLLEFEVNGKAVGKLSRRDMKGKRVRITTEGLTVEK